MIRLSRLLLKLAVLLLLIFIVSGLIMLFFVSSLKSIFIWLFILGFELGFLFAIVLIGFVIIKTVKKRSKKLTEELELKLSSINNDGYYFEYTQEGMTIYTAIKKRIKKTLLTRKELNNIFKNDLCVVRNWMLENNHIELYVNTHEAIIKTIKREFKEDFKIETIKVLKKPNLLIWIYTVFKIRGKVTKRPSNFALYKISIIK
ncbi:MULTISPECIES: hypothetical protein [unclassified Lysinibacillus]|uniref:hypothetical protein n=1 Tax=unclassified Lysinibacillus TaxID=2636778 RepID=UPI0038114FD1